MKLDQRIASNHENETYLFTTDMSQEQVDSMVWGAFKTGDRRAFDFIFQKYVKLLYAYGGKITKDQNLVEDSIQDLFVELWQKRGNLSDVSSIRFYLLKGLRRRITRKLTSGQALVPQDPEVLEELSAAELPLEYKMVEEQAALEQREKLLRALTLLSKRQREAIYLKFYEKITYEQLAELMNLGVKSAYNLIGKAIETLRKNI